MAFRDRRSTSSQLQTLRTQSGFSEYSSHTTPVFDIVRRDYTPSRTDGLGAGGAYEYQTATSIKQEDATTMSGKRTASGEPDNISVKQPKTEHPEEFSKQVRTKLQGSSRTGQACDRCKVRKIRCDGLPGGCSPCLQNETECRTTDRITGRATQRGYVEGIEQQNRDLQQRVRELEQRLIQNGTDVKPSNGFHDAASPSFNYNQPTSTQAPSWSPVSSAYAPQAGNALSSQPQDAAMSRTRAEGIGDMYLGVSPGNSYLSEIRGTALSILGMTIDIADFECEDMDEPDRSSGPRQLYNKSYQAFLQSALNINPAVDSVDLPSREDAFMYAQWYFQVLNPYMPLLHKPTFMKLLTSWYDDPSFRPTTAEIVIVHMVFAILFFQMATRNRENPEEHQKLTYKSNMFYHYCMGKFFQLSVSHTAHDVQAFALICVHLRNFPKPGASWLLTETSLSLAIELGLHRSAKKWVGDNPPNPLEVEMRKRTFWTLFTIHVTLAGKLGRPMTLRFEDFDVEMPEEVDDELLSEQGLDLSRPGNCRHKIGLHALRLMPLYMEMYSTIYAVRRQPDNYMRTVHTLEAKLRAWKASCPPEILNGETGQDEQERRIFGLYTKTWEYEFRLLLRHPSVAGTTDAAFRSESMRICVDCSRQMLVAVQELQRHKSLDTTWYQSAVYVLAITTTLFAQWEKRRDLTEADVVSLGVEMDLWLGVMGEVGSLLGSGTRLREAVKNVTHGTLGFLEKNLPSKNTFTSLNTTEQSRASPQQAVPHSASPYPKPPTYNYDNRPASNGNAAIVSAYITADGQVPHQQTPYPQATQYPTYSEPASTSNIAYAPQETHPYPPYSAPDPHPTPLLTDFAPQESWQRRDIQMPSTSQAWHQWAHTMTHSIDLQDSYSANALMQLGASASVPTPQETMDQAQWPLNIFDIGVGGTGTGRAV